MILGVLGSPRVNYRKQPWCKLRVVMIHKAKLEISTLLT